MAQLRPNLRTEAVAFMKKKMDTESIENAAGVLNGMLSSGQVADGVIEQLFTHLTPTADRKVAKEAFLNTFKAWAVSAMETDPEAVKRSEEHTSELQSLMRISYAVFCLT